MIYLYLYRILSLILLPVWCIFIYFRVFYGKEDRKRYLERFATAVVERPAGELIWFHAVSVGEFNVIEPLIRLYLKKFPQKHFLITTSTVTSAALCKKSELENVVHQYLPIDSIFIVKKFLKHWKPDLAVFTESEVWPNFLYESKKLMPVLLINARLSNRSFKRWKSFQSFFTILLGLYDKIMPGTKADYNKFAFFYEKNLNYLGSLKYASPPIKCNQNLFEKIKYDIKDRLAIIYASTHRGEEEIAANLHHEIKKKYPNILSLIVPRHIERTAEIIRMLSRHQLSFSLYTENHHSIADNTDIYIVNTIGELGTFYRLVDISFVGGSIVNAGGHNVLEPAKLGLAVLVGPYHYNFTEIVEDMKKQNALLIVSDQQELLSTILSLIENNDMLKALQAGAEAFTQKQVHTMSAYVHNLEECLQKSKALS